LDSAVTPLKGSGSSTRDDGIEDQADSAELIPWGSSPGLHHLALINAVSRLIEADKTP
jgi:hypothetical protein